MKKIYTVTHMHGGWVTDGYPEEIVVAESKQEAIDKVLEDRKFWDRKNTHASEFKIEGYVIEVYDEKTYKREKNIDSIIP